MPATLAYPHRRAGHCASGAFRDLFEFRGYQHNGTPLSEAMVFGLGAGLDVLFMERPTRRMPFYLGGRTAALEEQLLARIGGSLERHAESDEEIAWQRVKERLDRGEPVALVGDCQKLEYLKTRTSMPLHVIVAVGYDETHALIADNDRDEIQRCSHASLRAARSAHGFPLPAMNVTFEIRWPDALPPLQSLVLPAIAETVAWMRAPHGPATELFGAHSFGLGAIERLEAFAPSLDTLDAKGKSEAALSLWIFIEKAGTGGAFFRNLYRDFLAEALTLAPSSAMARAHAHYVSLADAWSALGRQTASGDATRLGAALTQLAQAEREGIALLASVVAQ